MQDTITTIQALQAGSYVLHFEPHYIPQPESAFPEALMYVFITLAVLGVIGNIYTFLSKK